MIRLMGSRTVSKMSAKRRHSGCSLLAPPMELNCVVAAQGFYRDKDNGHLYLEKWKTGDQVVCGLMDKTVVILGRLGGTAWAIPVR